MTMNKHNHIDLSAGQDRTGQQLRLSKVLAVVAVTNNLDLTDPQTGCEKQENLNRATGVFSGTGAQIKRGNKSRGDTRCAGIGRSDFSVNTEHKQQRFRPRPRGGGMTSLSR